MTSWCYKKHTGKNQLSFRRQVGIGFRRPRQPSLLRQRLIRRRQTVGARPNIFSQTRGLGQAEGRRLGQSREGQSHLQLPGRTVSWFCSHLPSSPVGRSMIMEGFWRFGLVRLGRVSRCWHVLAVYQHVWSPANTVQANKADRSAVLRSFSRCVKQVPARDTFIIAGDFNSAVTSLPRLVGPRTIAPQEAPA